MNRVLAAVARRTAAHKIVLGTTGAAMLLELVPGPPEPLLIGAGAWLLLGALSVLWYGFTDQVVSTRDGRVLIAIVLAVVTDIVALLLLNTVLPLLGDLRPLARPPLAISCALTVLGIAWCLPPAVREKHTLRDRFSRPMPGLTTVLILGGLSLTLAVAGAFRLNNGLGSTVSVLALLSMAVLIGQLLWRRRRYPEVVLELGLFLVAAALLLLTSLRGWYITGHDIQREFEMFQLTSEADRWRIAPFRDPYNACMSITLLPTAISRLTAISGLYVFKAVFPVLFAVTVPLIYRSVRNVAPRVVALLSAVYFIAFPTFFTDMTFLARQEIAFLILGGAMVLLTKRGQWQLRHRRIVFVVMLGGVVLSHYSTSYLIVVVLGVAVLAGHASRLRVRGCRLIRQPGIAACFTTVWMVVVVAAATAAWNGPLTRTSGQFRSTASQTVRDIIDPGRVESRSSDTSYSLFGGSAAAPQQRLAQYQQGTLELTAKYRAAGDYLPISVLDRYPIQPVKPHIMPITKLGHAIQRVTGLDVGATSRAVRQSAARLLQVLLLLGIVICLWSRRRPFRPSRDQMTLTAAMLFVIGLLTVLPQLSVDYGVLRAFQQGLFIFAPFIAAGSLWMFRWARRWMVPAASALALVLFLDFTGVIPQVVGGSQAQLNLNNAGPDYDVFYVHPEERTAITWVERHATAEQREHIQSEILTDRYTFSRLQTLLQGRPLNDIFPTIISTNSYAFLGSTTVRKGEAPISSRGDLVIYRYPLTLLDSTKNKVYSSEGAEVFR